MRLRQHSADGRAFRSRRVLLVGGGRWGRVHAGVLRRLLPKDGELLWVTRHNLATLKSHISAWNDDGVGARLFDDLDEALSCRPDAAVIATSPREHAAHAKIVLNHEVHVLVEKPLALREEDACDLLNTADQRGLILNVGVHLFYASYLEHFRSLWRGRFPLRGRVIWREPETEIRYGEIKQPDYSTPIIHDVFPHVWSILCILFPAAPPIVHDAAPGARGSVMLSLSVDGIPFSISLDRRARNRLRRIELEFDGGRTADLDFTVEPGAPRVDGAVVPFDPQWHERSSPLALELTAFLTAIDGSNNSAKCPNSARDLIGSVSGAVAASRQLRDKEVAALAFLLSRRGDPRANATARAILMDNLIPEMKVAFNALQDVETVIDTAISILLQSEHQQELRSDLSKRLEQSEFLDLVKASLSASGASPPPPG